MTAHEAIQLLRKHGVTLTLSDSTIRVRYALAIARKFDLRGAIEALKRDKQEAIRILGGESVSASPPGTGKPR